MKRHKLCLLLCMLLLQACSEDKLLQPLAEGSVILAFGDSLTRGTGARDGQSYPDVLSRLTGFQVINAGVPGELSQEGRQRLPALLDEHMPTLLILCHGGNDLLQKKSESAAAENIRAMIAAAQQKGIPVLLLGVPKPSIFVSTASFYNEIADDTGVLYEGDIFADVIGDADLRSDTVHPNATGYRLVAEQVAQALQAAGAF